MTPGARAPRGRGLRFAAGAILGLALLAACVKEAPLIPAGDVYDPKDALARAQLEGVDSVQVFLVDAADSARSTRLWSGTVDSLSRIPVHVAREGERFVFRIEGFRRDRGLCYVETVREKEGRVSLDACKAPLPAKAFVDTLLDFGRREARLALRLGNADRFPGRLRLTSRQGWIVPVPDTLRLVPGDTAPIQVTIRRGSMVPGPWRGRLYLRDSTRLLDSVEIAAEIDSLQIWGGGKKVEFASGDTAKGFKVPVPFADGPDWMRVSDAPWLELRRHWDQAYEPGAVSVYELAVRRQGLASGRHVAVVRAVGRGGRIFDSLTVIADHENWHGGIAGQVMDWGNQPVPGARTVLEGADSATRGSRPLVAQSDTGGRFRFESLKPGRYRLSVQAEGRLGSVKYLQVGDSVLAAQAGVTKPVHFNPVRKGWGGKAIGRPALVDGYVVAPTRSPVGEGRVLAFPLGSPVDAMIIPQGNLLDMATGRAMQAAETAGKGGNLFFSYPLDSTVIALQGWKGTTRVRKQKLPFPAFGLEIVDSVLAVAGRLSATSLALAELRAQDLSLIRVDTLELGYSIAPPAWEPPEWQLDNGPRIESDSAWYFLADGTDNLPGGPARVHALRKSTRRLEYPAWPAAGDTGIKAVLHYPGWQPVLPNGCDVYVAGLGGIRGGMAGGAAPVLRIPVPALRSFTIFQSMDVFSGFQDYVLAAEPGVSGLSLFNLQSDARLGMLYLPGQPSWIASSIPGLIVVAIGTDLHVADLR